MRQDILQVFFLSTISSVVTSGCVCWGGSASNQDRDRLEKTIRKAGGVSGKQQETFESVYHRRPTDRLMTMLSETSFET